MFEHHSVCAQKVDCRKIIKCIEDENFKRLFYVPFCAAKIVKHYKF
jgi:hypothetical protein